MCQRVSSIKDTCSSLRVVVVDWSHVGQHLRPIESDPVESGMRELITILVSEGQEQHLHRVP